MGKQMDRERFVRMLQFLAHQAGSWSALARQLEVTPQYLSDVKDGRRAPGKGILKGLGMERVVTYRKVKR